MPSRRRPTNYTRPSGRFSSTYGSPLRIGRASTGPLCPKRPPSRQCWLGGRKRLRMIPLPRKQGPSSLSWPCGSWAFALPPAYAVTGYRPSRRCRISKLRLASPTHSLAGLWGEYCRICYSGKQLGITSPFSRVRPQRQVRHRGAEAGEERHFGQAPFGWTPIRRKVEIEPTVNWFTFSGVALYLEPTCLGLCSTPIPRSGNTMETSFWTGILPCDSPPGMRVAKGVLVSSTVKAAGQTARYGGGPARHFAAAAFRGKPSHPRHPRQRCIEGNCR
jgi:hypothetical protein